MKELLTGALAFILSFLGGSVQTVYLQLSSDQTEFIFRTGEQQSPFYGYLNVKNIGTQSARFDAASTADWLIIYREGQPTARSLTITQTEAVDFILEIHPERLAAGRYSAEARVTVVDLRDSSVLDNQAVEIVLKKDFSETPVPTPTSKPTPATSISTEPSTNLPAPTTNPGISPVTIPARPTVSVQIRPRPSRTKIPPIDLRPPPTVLPAVTSAPPLAIPGRSAWHSFWGLLRRLFF